MRHRLCGLLVLSAVVSLAFFAGFAFGAGNDSAKADTAGIAFFEAKIRPVLVKHCYQCHSAEGGKKIKGGLRVDSREALLIGGDSGAAIVPRKPDESLLLEALRYESYEMPPSGQLPEEVIADFARWVKMGAPDPRGGEVVVPRTSIDIEAGRSYWAFQPPRAVEPPAVEDGAWPRSDIDRFVLAELESRDLSPVADADRRTLLRRLSLDLIGLPPTEREIADFLADDSSEAIVRVVDRLLASPHFGERWGRHWLDVARYGESTGKERNYALEYAWRYRDYVIESVNADKPYDLFIREQVAGDLLPHSNTAERDTQRVATGFLAIGPKGLNERSSEQYRMDEVDDQIDVTCRAVLGLTVSCARCHDHKFDPIPTTDYYALAGIFRSSDVLAGVSRGRRGNSVESLLALGSLGDEAFTEVRARDKELADLQAEQTRLGREIRDLKGGGDAPLSEVDGVSRKSKKSGDANTAPLSVETRIAKREARMVVVRERIKAIESTPPPQLDLAMAVVDADKPADIRLCVRGEVDQRGPQVPRGFVQVASWSPAVIDAKSSGRLELAEWLTSRDNPLTARVLVNRVWHHLFGTGIVRTVDDFGVQGEAPSHPALLDHLAIGFMEDGYSLKRLIKEIVTSHVYQLSSAHDEVCFAADPSDRLLWRMNPRRVEAEVLRDCILAVGGELDLDPVDGSVVLGLGGRELAPLSESKLLPVAYRRSVYLPSVRNMAHEFMDLFDAADSSLVVGDRDSTTVPTQALFMLNSPFVREQSEKAAKLLLAKADRTDDQRLASAFDRFFARLPTDTERESLLVFLADERARATRAGSDRAAAESEAWTRLCQTLFATAEFRYVY